MKAFVSRKECILARYEFGARYKRFWCAIQMFSERETNSNQSQVGFLIDLNWSSCLRNRRFTVCNNGGKLWSGGFSCRQVIQNIPNAWSAAGIKWYVMTSQTVPSRFDLYPGYVLTESGTFFFRSNSRWYGCCDWLLVPRGVSLDSHRTWTDSWCADLLPRNKRIHSRNKRIHSRNKCIHSRKTVSVSRI